MKIKQEIEINVYDEYDAYVSPFKLIIENNNINFSVDNRSYSFKKSEFVEMIKLINTLNL